MFLIILNLFCLAHFTREPKCSQQPKYCPLWVSKLKAKEQPKRTKNVYCSFAFVTKSPTKNVSVPTHT